MICCIQSRSYRVWQLFPNATVNQSEVTKNEREGGRREREERVGAGERFLSNIAIWSIFLLSNKETSINLGRTVRMGKLLFLHVKENGSQCEKSQEQLKPFCYGSGGFFRLLAPDGSPELMKSPSKEAP